MPEDYKLSFNPEEYINSSIQDISANNYENVIRSADDDQGACDIIMNSYKNYSLFVMVYYMFIIIMYGVLMTKMLIKSFLI